MVDVQTVTVVIAGISVIVGVINSILSSRRATKNNQLMLETRQAQLFMQVYSRWSSPEFRIPMVKMQNQWSQWKWKDVAEFNKQYSSKLSAEEYVTGFTIPGSFFEGIGVLVERGLIDVTLVKRLLNNSLIAYWEQLEPVILDYRKRMRHDRQPLFDSFEYLYKRLRELDQQQATEST